MSIFMSDAYVNIYKDPHHTHYKSHLPDMSSGGRIAKFMFNRVYRILESADRTDNE